jgi:hypothetical protein
MECPYCLEDFNEEALVCGDCGRQKAIGTNAMSVNVGREELEEIVSWDVSDEALEIAGAA